MANMVLYCDTASPPVRACLMLIKILKLDVKLKYIDLFTGEQFHHEFLKLNPAHTVPTLVHDELILTDSHAILIYLCEIFEKEHENALWPKTSTDRIRVMNMLFFECSILFRRDSDFLSELIKHGSSDIDMKHHERKIKEAYKITESYLESYKYFATNYLTIADISILPTICTLNLVFPFYSEDTKDWPRLREWFERMKELPEYSINEEGLNRLIDKMGKHLFPAIAPK